MAENFPNVIKDMNVNIRKPNKLQAWKTQTYIKMQSVSQCKARDKENPESNIRESTYDIQGSQ